jgi:Holliday junction resolvase
VSNPYLKGRRYEYYVASLYTQKGYFVRRVAGSKGPFDLIAIHPEKGEILLIQVKKRGPIRQEERKRLSEFRGVYTVKPLFYVQGQVVEA